MAFSVGRRSSCSNSLLPTGRCVCDGVDGGCLGVIDPFLEGNMTGGIVVCSP